MIQNTVLLTDTNNGDITVRFIAPSHALFAILAIHCKIAISIRQLSKNCCSSCTICSKPMDKGGFFMIMSSHLPPENFALHPLKSTHLSQLSTTISDYKKKEKKNLTQNFQSVHNFITIFCCSLLASAVTSRLPQDLGYRKYFFRILEGESRRSPLCAVPPLYTPKKLLAGGSTQDVCTAFVNEPPSRFTGA